MSANNLHAMEHAVTRHNSIVATVVVVGLTGCAVATATLIQAPGSVDRPAANAPVNQDSRPGVIRYKKSGILAAQRRDDAYSQMSALCAGKYRIESEGSQTRATGAVVTSPTTASVINTEYWYINFSCVRDSAATPPR